MRWFHAALVLACQPSTSQWTPRNNPHALILANGDQFPFGLTVEQVVKRLQTHDRFPMHGTAKIDGFLKLPTAKVADADIAHLATANQPIEGAERFFQRR